VILDRTAEGRHDATAAGGEGWKEVCRKQVSVVRLTLVCPLGACSDQLGVTQSPFLRENSLLRAREHNLLFFGSFATETCMNSYNNFDKAAVYKS